MSNDKIRMREVKKPPGNKLFWGTVVFIIGVLSPLAIPLVIASGLPMGFKSLLSGLLAFGIPEVFMLIAVAIMGKSGFNYLKRLLSVLLRRYGPPETVSRARYYTGVILFLIPIIIALALPYLFSHLKILSDSYLLISICSDLMLIISLFILGGEFWDKLRGLFVWGASINFPKKNE